jgi:hypothetical protein
MSGTASPPPSTMFQTIPATVGSVGAQTSWSKTPTPR